MQFVQCERRFLALIQRSGLDHNLITSCFRLVLQVGGYAVAYNGLEFATVRGAGHEVPMYQPVRALTLFKMFLAAH